MLDLKHEFFRPVWVRIATTAVAGVWSVFEFSNGAPFWGVIFGALAAWCGWNFFTADYMNHKPVDKSVHQQDD